jgi:murein DD-endopeptidase MepM/ murein hydrolase activator NlpD
MNHRILKTIGLRALFFMVAGLLSAGAINADYARAEKIPSPLPPFSSRGLFVPETIWAGEPFLISFGAEGLRSLEVIWNGKRLAFAPQAGEETCPVLLAVSLTEKAASLPLILQARWTDGTTRRYAYRLSVRKRNYPVQRITVDAKYVTPPEEERERIKRERAQLRAVIDRISPARYWSLPMLRPVPGEVTSRYGLRRVINGQERAPHKGVDFDANEGDPVAAMDRGVVALTAEHYYNGKIVIVDHGFGVYSLYLHLSDIAVKQGQFVGRGERIGLIGSTGRSTGPHLHLSFAVWGDMVDGATCMGERLPGYIPGVKEQSSDEKAKRQL